MATSATSAASSQQRHPPRLRSPRQLHGQGRKRRITPLTAPSFEFLRVCTTECGSEPDAVLFPISRGTALSHDALAQRLLSYLTDGCCVSHRLLTQPSSQSHQPFSNPALISALTSPY
jgi:hypothetical protein